MRRFACLLLIMTAAALQAGDEPDYLRRLVGRLASSDFREREAATRELGRIGEPALEALRQAERSGDRETSRRAAELIERIGQRQAVNRILAPTLVTLDYENTPLTEAIADLGRRTGLAIVLHADNDKVAARSVTLFAEKLTAWQAIRLLCHRAGLHESDGGGLPPAVLADAPGPLAGMLILGQMPVRRGQLGALTAPSPVTRIDLVDGPGQDPPTHDAGSVRIRIGPAATQTPSASNKEILVGLFVMAEGGLHVDGAADLRIDRAIDERGHERASRPTWPLVPDEPDDWPRGVRLPPQITERKHGPVAIRFEKDELPTRRLRELAGAVTIQAFAAEPIGDIVRPAAGQSLRKGGVALTLASWNRNPDGEMPRSRRCNYLTAHASNSRWPGRSALPEAAAGASLAYSQRSRTRAGDRRRIPGTIRRQCSRPTVSRHNGGDRNRRIVSAALYRSYHGDVPDRCRRNARPRRLRRPQGKNGGRAVRPPRRAAAVTGVQCVRIHQPVRPMSAAAMQVRAICIARTRINRRRQPTQTVFENQRRQCRGQIHRRHPWQATTSGLPQKTQYMGWASQKGVLTTCRQQQTDSTIHIR